ncbi:MAG: triose-phosphate isomerase [Phycisphaerae bacterium]|jgi:triosephosphate isomerase|nr:triose-phosphate isomerase [Phycisphaerae bacterium]
MNTELITATELAESVSTGVSDRGRAETQGRAVVETVDVAVFPPFPYLQAVGHALGHRSVLLGAQDVSAEDGGAFTGQVSANMLTDLGVQVALVGHSERRHGAHYGLSEDDELLARKVRIALDYGLIVVLCIGETLGERKANEHLAVLDRQVREGLADVEAEDLRQVVVAYEPVWAIGTGNTATPQDAQHAHAHVRGILGTLYGADEAGGIRIIYGGSMNLGNAAELLRQPDIDGGLIGGASLKPNDFLGICAAAAARGSAVGR